MAKPLLVIGIHKSTRTNSPRAKDELALGDGVAANLGAKVDYCASSRAW